MLAGFTQRTVQGSLPSKFDATKSLADFTAIVPFLTHAMESLRLRGVFVILRSKSVGGGDMLVSLEVDQWFSRAVNVEYVN